MPSLTGSLGRAAGPAVTAAATAAFLLDVTLRGHPGALAVDLARYGDLAVHP